MGKWKGDIVFILVIAALIGGWMYLYPGDRESPLSSLAPPEDLSAEELPTYATLDGLKLAYRSYEPSGPATHVLVFLHDTLLHSGWYADMARDLASQGVAVLLPDRRGWGHSEGDRDEVAKDRSVLAQDIITTISVAQAKYPQSEIFVGAHGRAAGLVMRYTLAQRPIPGVVLIAPYISDDQPNLRPEGWHTLLIAHPGEAFLAQSGLFDWRVWRCNWPKPMVEVDPLIEVDLSITLMQETVPDDVDATYEALHVPLLCLQGQADPLFHPERTVALLERFATPDRQLEILPGADYLSVLNEAAGPIVRWLNERE